MEGNYWQRRLSRRAVLRYGGVAGLGIAGASLIACGSESTPTTAPTSTTTATASATASPSPSATASASVTGSASPSVTASASPSVTASASPSATASASATPSATSTATGQTPKRGGQAKVLQPTGLDHLDPTTNTYPGGFVIALAYGQLFKWKAPALDDPGALEAEPYMAASIERPDDTTAIIKLRPGIKYHNIDPVNGREMTPEDIAATWTRIKDPATASTRILQQQPVHVPEAVDNLTAKFTFDFPFAPFFNYIADVWQSIVAKEAIDKGTDWLKQNLIGTGPWQVAKVDTGVSIDMQAFPIPWWTPWVPNEPAPYFESLTLPVIPDDIAKQSIAFQGGQLDYGTVSQADWQTIQASPDKFGIELLTAQDFNYMRINQGIKPMDDLRVRQALSCGIDRPGCVQTAFEGVGAVPTGPIPTARTPWGQDPADVPYHTLDKQKATQLLSAAGYDSNNPLELTNEYPAQDNQQTDYVKAFTAQLKDLNVNITQDQNEYGAYLEKCKLAKTDPQGAGWHINMHWGNRYNDIDGYLAEYKTDGGRNYGHWGSADLDAKINDSAKITDIKQRVEAIHAINQVIADQAMTPGLVLPVYANVWNAKIGPVFTDAAEWYTGTRNFIDHWFTE